MRAGPGRFVHAIRGRQKLLTARSCTPLVPDTASAPRLATRTGIGLRPSTMRGASRAPAAVPSNGWSSPLAITGVGEIGRRAGYLHLSAESTAASSPWLNPIP